MRHRHRRKKSEGEEVQMNLAAMLDMAFQLLTFFILTFRPAPIEGHLSLNLPPPVAQVKMNAGAAGGAVQENIEDDSGLETLHLFVEASESGDVTQIRMETGIIARGGMDEANAQRLDKELKGVFGRQINPFDRIQIAMDGQLRYGELMKIVDICTRQKKPDGTFMQKVSFVEMNKE